MREGGLAEYQDSMMIMAFVLFAIAALLVIVIAAAAIFIKSSRELCMRKLEYRRYFSEKGVFEGEET